jgi:hypothetical protein
MGSAELLDGRVGEVVDSVAVASMPRTDGARAAAAEADRSISFGFSVRTFGEKPS